MNLHTLCVKRQIPQGWRVLVDELSDSAAGLRPFIAGGAVRDLLHDVRHKDVDIWVPAAHRDRVRQLIDDNFPEARLIMDGAYAEDPRVVAVWEFRCGQELVNVIVFDGETVEDCLTGFDLSVSQAVLIFLPFGLTAIRVSAGFMSDSANRVFRQIRDEASSRTFRRVHDSLLPRYPGWTYVPFRAVPPAPWTQGVLDL